MSHQRLTSFHRSALTWSLRRWGLLGSGLLYWGVVGLGLLPSCGGIVVDGDASIPGGPLESSGSGGTTAGGGAPAPGDTSAPDEQHPSGTGGTLNFPEPGNPQILPSNQPPYGQPHSYWLERYWQWFLSIQHSIHPREGGDCTIAQGDDVWFLTTGQNNEVERRTCTVPLGRPVFIVFTSTLSYPMADCSSCSPSTHGPLAWEEQLDDELADAVALISKNDLTLWVDDVELRVGSDYLFTTPTPFYADVPSSDAYFSCIGPFGPNMCGWQPGTARPIVAAAYAAMLTPLPSGKHQIRFGAKNLAWNWHTDVTYEVMVQ